MYARIKLLDGKVVFGKLEGAPIYSNFGYVTAQIGQTTYWVPTQNFEAWERITTKNDEEKVKENT